MSVPCVCVCELFIDASNCPSRTDALNTLTWCTAFWQLSPGSCAISSSLCLCLPLSLSLSLLVSHLSRATSFSCAISTQLSVVNSFVYRLKRP